MSKKDKKKIKKTVEKTVTDESIARYKPALKGLLKAIKKEKKEFKMSGYLKTLELSSRGWLKAAEQCGFISKKGLKYTANMKAKKVTDETINELFLQLRENNQAAEKKRKENVENAKKIALDIKKAKKKESKKAKKKKSKNKSNLSQLVNWFKQ